MKEKLLLHSKDMVSQLPAVEGIDRNTALDSFGDLGFPHTGMEKWQKSRIKNILRRDYTFPTSEDKNDWYGFELEDKIPDAWTINYVNSKPVSADLLVTTGQGIIYGDLKMALSNHPELVTPHFNKYIKQGLNGLNALNNALFEHGLFVYIPRNVQAEKAIHFINRYIEDTGFRQLRNLVIVESGASLTLLHSDLSGSGTAEFTNSVTEVFVGANASLKWYKEQDLGKDSAVVNSIFCHQERDSRFTTLHSSLNGNMIRNDVHVKMMGEGCEANVFGLYLPVSDQQVDNQVKVVHEMPNCVSNELFKGVLDGNGTAVFNGHILVQQDAQKTNAYQTNRNIILSDEAFAYAKPFLEIYADDVKCSHGATIGQLDQQALFYLRSRGLSEMTARQFLIRAFIGEVIDKCDHVAFRSILERKVQQKLNK